VIVAVDVIPYDAESQPRMLMIISEGYSLISLTSMTGTPHIDTETFQEQIADQTIFEVMPL
jgi:hypothetical protein